MGAAIALRAAALDSRTLALVLEAPMVDLVASTGVVLRRRRLPFPKTLARRVVRRASRLAGMPIDRPSPVETAPLVRCPTAMIHGTEDSIVPIQEARRLAGAFTRPPCWFEIKGAKHIDVVDVGGQALLEQVAAVLEKAVGAGGAVEKE
jgi:pimeloyl-ACP methyl ester carboxylesterase